MGNSEYHVRSTVEPESTNFIAAHIDNSPYFLASLLGHTKLLIRPRLFRHCLRYSNLTRFTFEWLCTRV